MKASIDKRKVWYVAMTNIKSEAKAANNIRLAGFDYYYPRYRVERKHRRTNLYSVVERPLLMRYVFVGFDPWAKHFGFVRSCEGVERLLEVQGEPVAVPAESIEAILLAEIDMMFDDTREARIHRREEARTKKETVRMKFHKGQPVEVLDGPFSAFSAIVEEVTSSGRVEALINLFGRWSSVSFEAEQLSPCAA